jgi:type IV pilus assembly protein PilP
MRVTIVNRKWKMAAFWTMPMFIFSGLGWITVVQATSPPEKLATPQRQQQEEVYRYNPQGRIDPFKPFFDPAAAAKQKAVKSKTLPLNPLQRLGIEQFRLVGIIEGDRGRRAMVQDASGKFYSLVQGSYIGLNNGRVAAILKDEIIVNEKVTTDEGKIQSRKQTLKLRQDEVKP